MRIKTIEESEATGTVKAEFDRLIEHLGMIPNATRIFSLQPRLFQLHNDMYRIIMIEKSALPKPVKQLLALVAANAMHCEYCRFWHTRFLDLIGVDPDVIRSARGDFRQAEVDAKIMCLLEYTDLIARDARASTDGRVEQLRQFGYGDEQILEATAIVGYIAFISRIIDGLGVEIEEQQHPSRIGG